MKPVFERDSVSIYHGHVLDVLRELPDCCMDSVVTDPPYELGFMGKGWDSSGIAYSVEMWAQCLVLDCFAGSGTTGEAALIEGFSVTLIEREAAYIPLIEQRLTKPIQPVL